MAPAKQPGSNPSDTQLGTVDQGKAEDSQIQREANEIAKRENLLTGEGNRIQWQLVWIGAGTILAQVILTLVQIYFIRVANRYAGDAARAATESAHVAKVALEVAERADVLVERCEFEDGYENTPLRIMLFLTNTGRTRAIIIAHIAQIYVGARSPVPLSGNEVLQQDLRGFVIHPQRTCNHRFSLPNPFGPEKLQAIREGRETFYFYGRFLYYDGFRVAPREPYEAPFLLRYDVKRKQFEVAGVPDYKRSA